MGRAWVRAALSAIASVLLSGLIVVLAGFMIRADAADNEPIEPCAPGQPCDPVTVTVTQTITPTAGRTSAEPEPVVTRTVTVTPSPTAAPRPTATVTLPMVPTQEERPQTSTTPSAEIAVPQPSVSLPTATEPSPTPSPVVSFAEPNPQTAAVEIRDAPPEYDKVTLSHRLAIPAAILALLALFAWFVLEGRLRRMAHAAAVRHAGPARPDAAAGHPAGQVYSPVIGYVPVQPYPIVYPMAQWYGPMPPQGYPQASQAYPQAYQGHPQAYQPGYPAYGDQRPQAYGTAGDETIVAPVEQLDGPDPDEPRHPAEPTR